MNTAATAQDNRYAIVACKQTKIKPEWQKVISTLKEKYPNAVEIIWNEKVEESLAELKSLHPRYTCFVAQPEEANRAFVASVHQLTRSYDEDPYCDTLWGILTGYDAENARRIAQERSPLIIHQVSSGTEIALSMCEEGVWYDELVMHKTVRKTKGDIITGRGPGDTTLALANTLTDGDSQLFVTSGHATERQWQIGFRYKNGFFQSKAGQMLGAPTTGDPFRIHSTTPKVYMAVGNCLMGNINGPDSMALAWMNDVGMRQMLGYTVLTWYGYGGWGVLDYFVEQPGRYSLTEAFHANHHALIHRINRYFPSLDGIPLEAGSRSLPNVEPTTMGVKDGLTAFDSRGLLWDRDVVAFYGDPGWEARMSEQPRAYEQTLRHEQNLYTFQVRPLRGTESFEPINTNGSQRGGRPIIEFLPNRLKNVEILSGHDLNPVVTDDFILIPTQQMKRSDKVFTVSFQAELAD